MKEKTSLTYRDAGVDIDAGNELVKRIGTSVESTRRAGVLSGIGGFGGLFELPVDRYRRPVLVSGTDGVGTKLKLAIESGIHDTIGIDLVAMCANDVLVTGAEPLFFLDYYATSRLELDVAEAVVAGIAEGCRQAGAALIGGETAEMPGIYSAGDYDLAGFCVGIVERDGIIDGSRTTPGDAVIGIASSGPHSNGYSLIRKVLEVSEAGLSDPLEGQTLGKHLLAPTRIYVKPVMALLESVDVHALAHVTGGGILENLPRVLPDGVGAKINSDSWGRPPVFDWLEQAGNIEMAEMYRTFNCGIGMIAVVPASQAERAIGILRENGETAWRIGELTSADRGVEMS